MSCEKNRGAFFVHVAAPDSPAAQTFGSVEGAVEGLETIFATARRQASSLTSAQQAMAAGKTTRLFAEMRAAGLTPPTHSRTGLPRQDAQAGYAAIYDTLEGLRGKRTMPKLATQVAEVTRTQHAHRARQFDAAVQRWRCGSCGRFLAEGGGHLCPHTATPEALQGVLARRLGVPAGAYPLRALDALLDVAKDGGIEMRHPLTGASLRAELDDLPLAMTAGYVPRPWTRLVTLVEGQGGRLAPVLEAAGLKPAPVATTAEEQAAVASGAVLPAGTPVVGPVEVLGMATSPATSPAVSAGTVPTVSGGTYYDERRFIGTEYRKGHGAFVEAGGQTYLVGDRSNASRDWSSARHRGLAAPPPGGGAYSGIAVGRTLVAAMEVLRTGSWELRADGVVELYDAEQALLAVYDPRTGTAGDVLGTANASAPQLAAVLAEVLVQPGGALEQAFIDDLSAFRWGSGSPLSAADGAYLLLKERLGRSGGITLGGTLSAARCPTCGRFMGANGCLTCPGSTATAPPEGVAVPPAPEEAPASTVPEAVVAPALAGAGAAVPDAAEAAVLPAPAAPEVVAPVAPQPVAVEVPTLTTGAPATPLASPVVVVPQFDLTAAVDARLATALDQLVERLGSLAAPVSGVSVEAVTAPVAPPAPPAPAAPLPPRADRPVPAPTAMTEAERLVSGLRLPRPDRTLGALDAALRPPGFVGISEDIPAVRRDLALNEHHRAILRRMTQARRLGMEMGRTNETRAFGIYGPPGTGKNTVAAAFAASVVTVDDQGNERQGMHLEQVEFDRDMDIGALIGTTTLERGTTVARLGPIGQAAVMGSVICLNEVVRNPKALTAFQSMFEEGEIRLKTPEGGILKIPVHPATTFILTWNPGLEGDADRPAEAPRSRLVASWELPQPTQKEQVERTKAFFSGASTKPTDAQVNAAVTFFQSVRTSIFQGTIQQRGRGSKAVPGPRDLNNFVMLGLSEGWPAALEQMRVFGDQNHEDRERDWKVIREQFALSFGADGRAPDRATPGRS
jgi:hypothetical protein